MPVLLKVLVWHADGAGFDPDGILRCRRPPAEQVHREYIDPVVAEFWCCSPVASPRRASFRGLVLEWKSIIRNLFRSAGSSTAYNWVDLKVRDTTTAAAGDNSILLVDSSDNALFTDQLCLQYSTLSRTQTQVASAHSGVLLQIWSGHVSRMGSNSTRYLHHTCAWNAAGHAGCSGCGCTVFARVHKARQQPSRIQIGVAMAGRRQPRMCMRVGVMSMRTRLHVIPSRASSCPVRGTVPRWGAEDGDMKVEFEVAYEEEEEIKGEAITLRVDGRRAAV
ncbi:hypothetical protein B0H11DRAFT_2264752 [Mycena galericulata]|nr:hypothetical protein B0H11DRAFT_2264752 [Mycena galericulata]